MWRFRSPARNGRRASVLAVAALAAAAFGCRGSDAVVEPPPAAAEAERPDELAELVRFGNHVREVDARQLAEHYRSLAFGDAFWSNDAAIRLSLLLSAPNSPYHDLDQATRFLRDVIERDADSPSTHKEFAVLLHHLLNERVYAASQDETLANLLGEARDENERLSKEIEQLRAELDAERKRRMTLEQQLDALRKLEEQLSLESVGRP